MARSELLAEPWVDGEREKARRRRDAVFLDDHRAVVQRRRRLKDADQQIVSEDGIERDPPFDVVPQPDLPLDRDDGADALRGEHARRHDELLDRLLGRFGLRKIAEERSAAQMSEGAPYIGLEQ